MLASDRRERDELDQSLTFDEPARGFDQGVLQRFDAEEDARSKRPGSSHGAVT
jgi:hypothetical protein